MIYHFMFGAPYETGCPVCSSIADTLDPQVAHLKARDTTLLLVSRAPLEKLLAFKRRMGWGIEWASSADSDFNRDVGFVNTPKELEPWPSHRAPGAPVRLRLSARLECRGRRCLRPVRAWEEPVRRLAGLEQRRPLFALGVMSLTWMGLIAVLVAFEKIGPSGRGARFASAGVLVVLAVAILAAPHDLPGFVVPGSPASPHMMKAMG